MFIKGVNYECQKQKKRLRQRRGRTEDAGTYGSHREEEAWQDRKNADVSVQSRKLRNIFLREHPERIA